MNRNRPLDMDGSGDKLVILEVLDRTGRGKSPPPQNFGI